MKIFNILKNRIANRFSKNYAGTAIGSLGWGLSDYQAGMVFSPEDTPAYYKDLLEAYKNYVYICANKNALSVASVQLELFVAKQNHKKFTRTSTAPVSKEKSVYFKDHYSYIPSVRKAVDFEQIMEHPFYDLLKNVNPFANQFEFIQKLQLFLELCGNSYLYLLSDTVASKRVPRELWLFSPNQIRIIPSRDKFIKEYLFIPEGGFQEERSIQPEEIIHFKDANPKSYYYGMSPLAAVADIYNLSTLVNKYERAIFKNMGAIAGYFHTEQNLTDSEYRRIKSEIKQNFGGVNKTGKSPLLNKVEYKNVGSKPSEMDTVERKKYVKEMIMFAYGQPLGLWDKESNRANSDNANLCYMRDTITPRLKRIEQQLNARLTPLYDENLFCAFSNCVPKDRELRLKETEGHLKNSVTTVNEERAALGLQPVPWGNAPLVPMNMAPLGSFTPQQQPGAKTADEMTTLVREKLFGRDSDNY